MQCEKTNSDSNQWILWLKRSINDHTVVSWPSLQLLNISLHYASVRSSEQCFCQRSFINKFMNAVFTRTRTGHFCAQCRPIPASMTCVGLWHAYSFDDVWTSSNARFLRLSPTFARVRMPSTAVDCSRRQWECYFSCGWGNDTISNDNNDNDKKTLSKAVQPVIFTDFINTLA